MYFEKRVFQSVAAYSSVVVDYVIPNGKTLSVSKVGVNTPTPYAEYGLIVWDTGGANEIMLSCSGNTDQEISSELVGDGVKAVRISLFNTGPIAQYLGAYFSGEQTI